MKYRRIKSRRKSAVAIKHSPPEIPVPKIVAKGHGAVAEKIIELARKHNIPIKEDPDLLHILSQINLNEEIPKSVYKVVAEILAFIYSINNKLKETQLTGPGQIPPPTKRY